MFKIYFTMVIIVALAIYGTIEFIKDMKKIDNMDEEA